MNTDGWEESEDGTQVLWVSGVALWAEVSRNRDKWGWSVFSKGGAFRAPLNKGLGGYDSELLAKYDAARALFREIRAEVDALEKRWEEADPVAVAVGVEMKRREDGERLARAYASGRVARGLARSAPTDASETRDA